MMTLEDVMTYFGLRAILAMSVGCLPAIACTSETAESGEEPETVSVGTADDVTRGPDEMRPPELDLCLKWFMCVKDGTLVYVNCEAKLQAGADPVAYTDYCSHKAANYVTGVCGDRLEACLPDPDPMQPMY